MTKCGSTGDLALSRSLRTESVDFGASKTKSRGGHTFITRVFFVNFGKLKVFLTFLKSQNDFLRKFGAYDRSFK